MSIRKTQITITILHEDDETPEGRSLAEIGAEIDEGGWIGSFAITASDLVPPEMLEAECVALGSDSTFFTEDER